MEVHIKGGGDHTMKFAKVKTHFLRENREPKVIIAQELNMKIKSSTSQTRLQGKSNRVFR